MRLNMLVSELEQVIKKKMEVTWKLLFNIDEVAKEREFFFKILLQIEVIPS